MGFCRNKDVLKPCEQLPWGGLCSMTSAQPPSLYMVLGRALLWALLRQQQVMVNTYCWLLLTEHGHGTPLEDGELTHPLPICLR